MAFNRQAHAGLGHQAARDTCNRAADFVCTDKAARGFDTQTLAVFDAKAGDFAVLDDIDTAAVAARA